MLRWRSEPQSEAIRAIVIILLRGPGCAVLLIIWFWGYQIDDQPLLICMHAMSLVALVRRSTLRQVFQP